MQKINFFTGIVLSVLLISVSFAEENKIPASAGPLKEEIKKTGDGIYLIGKVTIDQNNREIRFPGLLNMRDGEIEYLLCADGGKLHESVLYTDASPTHIQTGLLLLGLTCKNNLSCQGDIRVPKGDRVDIYVEWTEKDKKIRKRAEELINSLVEEKFKPMEMTSWAFSGSKMVEKKFAAEITKSIIATYRDPYAIINNVLEGGCIHSFYFVNKDAVPALETPVEIIIQAVPKQEKKENTEKKSDKKGGK